MGSWGGGGRALSFVIVAAAIVTAMVGTTLAFPLAGPESSSTNSSAMDGVVTGYVTAGPSQPTCTPDQPCIENMSGYSLVFTPQCTAPVACLVSKAPLSAGGHYSALLPAGVYAVSGLYPSCPWMGCSTTFPKTITVVGGAQMVLDFQIDTGIR